MTKPYTIWKMDDSKWLLEIEDEAMGEYVKDLASKPEAKVERFGVGINTPLRVYTVKEEDVLSVEKTIEHWLKKR